MKCCDFSELCQFCCSAGVLPAWCLYTHWHWENTEKGKSPKKTIFNEHSVCPSYVHDLQREIVLYFNLRGTSASEGLGGLQRYQASQQKSRESKRCYYTPYMLLRIWAIKGSVETTDFIIFLIRRYIYQSKILDTHCGGTLITDQFKLQCIIIYHIQNIMSFCTNSYLLLYTYLRVFFILHRQLINIIFCWWNYSILK